MKESLRKITAPACLLLCVALASCSSSKHAGSFKGPTKVLSPEEAYRQGKLKNKPYVIDGRVYVPMSYQAAAAYREIGVASWYGRETLVKNGHQPTAYGERFDPSVPTAAHKYLPLPSIVRVTNLENRKSIIVRVNDRGPFVDDRVIDLSAEAAKQLGFHSRGTARVLVEVVRPSTPGEDGR